MTILSKYLASAALVAVLALPGAANALTFTGNWAIGAINTTDPGLVVKTSSSGGGFSADLAVGGSHTFDLFRIWTDETSVNVPEDTQPKPFSVAFSFTDPVTDGTATGVTYGSNNFWTHSGVLTWDGPITLSFGQNNTGKLSLALSDAVFNTGLFGLKDGWKHGDKVTATLTYETAPIPLPATLPLLLGGIALAAAARRRAAARA